MLELLFLLLDPVTSLVWSKKQYHRTEQKQPLSLVDNMKVNAEPFLENVNHTYDSKCF